MTLDKEKSTINRLRTTPSPKAGYTFLELAIVLTILMIMIGVVSVNVFGRIKFWRLNEDVGQFAHTMQLAAEQAVFTGHTFAVVIGVFEGSYAIYPTDSDKKYNPYLKPLFLPQRLERCLIDEIKFQDGASQFSGDVVLYATPQGWSASVVFNLRDKDYRQRYVRCDWLTTRVLFDNKPLYFLEPRQNVSMYSPL